MTRFDLGPGLTCDLEALLNTRLLVQANSGAGKSWLLRRLLEQTHGKVQHLVIDPEGEFATLREKFDYVLAAREDGDTVADPRSAKLLAERLLELGASAILDIYELKAHERVLFVRRFLDALVNAPKRLWHPALVVIDEAHVYAPQVGEAESRGAVIDLCTRGRKRGFAAVLATQRLSKLHKDAAAECNNKLVGRTSLDVDMARAADELGLRTKDQAATLRALENGQFYAFGPAFSTREVSRVTVGPVQTTHPKAGSRLAAPTPAPSAKVRAILAKLADLPAEAEARERDLDTLKKDLAAKDRQIRDLQAERAKATPNIPESIPTPVLTDADRALLEKLGTVISEAASLMHEDLALASMRFRSELELAVGGYSDKVLSVTEKAERALRDALLKASAVKVLEKLDRVAAPAATNALRTPVENTKSGGARPHHAHAPHGNRRDNADRSPSGDTTTVRAGERRILTAIAQHRDGVTREQLTVLTGYKRSSRDTYLQRLGAAGLIDVQGGTITATPAGVQALGDDFEPLPTGRALQTYWLDRLPTGEAIILRHVLDAHPQAISRDLLSEATGYKRSSRDTYLQRLSARQLVVSDRDGVRAAAMLF